MTGHSLRIGQYDVTLLLDGLFEAPADVLIHADGDAARQHAIESWGKPTLQVDVNCFLLRGPAGAILIDAGTGTSWGPKYGHARSALRDAGITPGEIRSVVLTHIHGDHALGLLDGDEAYFPHAEVFVPGGDIAFFSDPAAREAMPEARRGGFKAAEQLLRVYGSRVKRIEAGEVLPGIEALPLPGHTPGHTGYLVRGGDKSLLCWGDTLHLGDLQPGDPKIGLTYDLDPELAARTRRAALEDAAREGWIIGGGHITGFGRVQRKPNGYRILPA
ncbi:MULTISPECIES: MBL fold metallo-hydrolase [unclassified Rhizobium]|jgi:glyoxylase-like metal-dependent hydrolase (beta-lactamase superfamily II)|uniref:AidB family quorum-quenching N-acyl homoserine lactonase n=1 Tax=unclassified Rhizobium TaxID=2613769 RepID=UPI000647B2DA|nr:MULTISPECIES: MBL fold metallo-hydrolase [unclassified Rhizobium]MBN8952717.1 MBL fold metallo-hydrolase [Rhizobium tropici]OJY71389.1 MAG: MBL fold metallo-hydrolase [Rhizobium sp. 60-20]RKD55208.1 glyoxylase-like metal-dependent hydrolase (beta-lactamase superfamily II) [Rhizobium sp. WW_1]